MEAKFITYNMSSDQNESQYYFDKVNEIDFHRWDAMISFNTVMIAMCIALFVYFFDKDTLGFLLFSSALLYVASISAILINYGVLRSLYTYLCNISESKGVSRAIVKKRIDKYRSRQFLVELIALLLEIFSFYLFFLFIFYSKLN